MDILDVMTAAADAKRKYGRGVLDSNYPTVPKGARLLALGHSIVAGPDGTSEGLYRDTIQHYASALSGGRLELIKNSGISSQTSAQILARFQTDVTPYSPDVVYIQAYVNDIYNSVPLEISKANHVALIEATRAIGAVPLMDTCLPADTDTPEQNVLRAQFNGWLRAYCAQNRVPCVDSWAAVVSPSGATWVDGSYTSDGIHPQEKGRMEVAKAIVAATSAWPVPFERLARTSGDPTNLVTNPLHLTYTGANGISDGWTETMSSTAASRTFSRVTDPAVPGFMQRISMGLETGIKTATVQRTITLTEGVDYTAGDTLALYCAATLTDTKLTPNYAFRGYMQLRHSGPSAPFQDVYAQIGVGIAAGEASGLTNITRAIIGRRFVARATTNTLLVYMTAQSGYISGSAGGSGTFDFGQVRFANLTRLGIR